MSEIELVIKIPEETYEYWKEHKYEYILSEAIANGIPLPKGHGRLVDADSIYQIVRPIEQSDTEWGMTAETAIRLIHEAFNRVPTIIEADKEEE